MPRAQADSHSTLLCHPRWCIDAVVSHMPALLLAVISCRLAHMDCRSAARRQPAAPQQPQGPSRAGAPRSRCHICVVHPFSVNCAVPIIYMNAAAFPTDPCGCEISCLCVMAAMLVTLHTTAAAATRDAACGARRCCGAAGQPAGCARAAGAPAGHRPQGGLMLAPL